MAKKAATKEAPAKPAVNFFNKAKVAAPATPAKKTKATVWVADGSGDKTLEGIEADVSTIISAHASMETFKNQKAQAAGRVLKYATSRFIEDFARVGVLPETPMSVGNRKGEDVTYVVQDKTASAKVSDEQIGGLVELLGEDAANAILIEETGYSFDSDILAQDGVSEALSAAIEATVAAGKLTPEQAEGLVKATTVRKVKAGTLARLADVCGKNRVLLEQVFATLNGPVCAYIKA